jgi:uncharacterized protein YbaP (TraB family)
MRHPPNSVLAFGTIRFLTETANSSSTRLECEVSVELRILRSIPSSSVLGAFLLALLLPGCATFHHAAPLRTDNVLFWKIRGPANVESEAYLLGSVHVADRPLEVDRRLSNAFAGATQLWLELAPGDMDAAHVSDAFYRYGMLAPKQDITSLLSPQTTELLQRYVNERGTKMESIHGKPWLLSIMIPMEEAARRGFHPELGVDRWFLAHAAGKEVFGLETLDFSFLLWTTCRRTCRTSCCVNH